MGAYTDPGVRRAARHGDGYLAPFPGYAEADRRVALARATARDAGRRPDELTFAFHQAFHVADDRDAFDEALPHLHYMSWRLAQMEEGYGANHTSVLEPPGPEQVERYRASIIAGSPVHAAKWVDTFRKHYGDEVVLIARLYLPGLPFERQVRAIELFARAVISQPNRTPPPTPVGGVE